MFPLTSYCEAFNKECYFSGMTLMSTFVNIMYAYVHIHIYIAATIIISPLECSYDQGVWVTTNFESSGVQKGKKCQIILKK